MNSFARINNQTIKNIDNEAIDLKQIKAKQPIKNTLKTIVEVPSARLFNRTYDETFTVKLSKNYDNLAQLVVKVTVTRDITGFLGVGDQLNIKDSFVPRIFKAITLQTVQNRFRLQKIIPEYTINRLDELNGENVYSIIEDGIIPDENFYNVSNESYTQTFYLPLFFFFSEAPSNFLNTRKLEELEVKLETNSSLNEMGFIEDINSLTIDSLSIISTYHDHPQTSVNDELIYTKKNEMKKIINSYDIFEEDIVQLTSGDTSTKFLLRCNYPLYLTSFSLIDSSKNKYTLQNVKFSINGQEFVKLDFKSNYSLYSEEKKYVESGSYSYWWNVLKNRCEQSGLITFSGSDNMSPVVVSMDLSDISDNSFKIVVYSEHLTEFEVDEYGTIRNKVSDSKLRYNQSYLPTNAGP